MTSDVKKDQPEFSKRTYTGEMNASLEGKDIHLFGWVHSIRDLGGIVFIQVRDVDGIVQVVVDQTAPASLMATAQSLKSEYVVHILGGLRRRAKDAVNPSIPRGDIEIIAGTIEVLNTSLVPPFPLDSREQPGEEVRLRYRYLDLRRDDMKDAVIKRHRCMQAARKYFTENRFIEIETPILNKSTPEGARDYLVPSRINKGKFYALPQSPQLFKQILMIAGFDRYFQIVKCFRDEDLRHDRQPEFTQIDLEFSFVTPEIIMDSIEGVLRVIVKDLRGADIITPFPRLQFDEAMERFGTDAPDMRFGLEMGTVNDIFAATNFNLFKTVLGSGGTVKAFSAPDTGMFSRKVTDQYAEDAKRYGAKGLAHVKYTGSAFEGGISKFLSDDEKKSLADRFQLSEPSILFFAADSVKVVNDALSRLRLDVARSLNLIDGDMLNFVWITEFPLFQYDNETSSFQAVHHPFTSPTPAGEETMRNLTPENVVSVKAQAYDVVLNGSEIGGGSIRIHNMDLQRNVFRILGISDEEANEKFSFLLEALQYGAPPHGGIALGLDRIMMLLLKRDSIRDVIPFPKTQRGQCLMSDAPSNVSPGQLQELSIKTIS